MLGRRAKAIALVAALSSPAALLGCVIGSNSEGCRSDSDCADGFHCRAGACLRVTTSESPPRDPNGTGDGGDAGPDHTDGG